MELNQEQSNNILWLTNKLVALDIDAKFSHLENGPVVTGYYFTPSHATPVKKMLNLSEDLALGIGADKVDVQRIGGHIVIFTPNKDRKIVEFKDLLYWYLHDKDVAKMHLPIPVGVNHRGVKCAFDLVDMPHVLIAGSTNSGKSVFESAILTSLAYFKDPSDLNFFLVDTKRVDLPLFKSLPHVLQVAEDLDQFHGMMAGIMPEIRRRLNMLNGIGCRNIQDYHRLGLELPYIVIIMDEFGDLIELDAVARKADMDGKYDEIPKVRSWIKQVVQIGRAAGVHLICCTQRSSVKIVDGDIKANLPCRIALRLPTSTDSRTILGCNGAENLLGKGDMLIQRPEQDIVQRFHGPFVSMGDITELVIQYEFVKRAFRR
jgi:S-DNA-T family DNA segregation ATPase FtsK/SpoIIIE